MSFPSVPDTFELLDVILSSDGWIVNVFIELVVCEMEAWEGGGDWIPMVIVRWLVWRCLVHCWVALGWRTTGGIIEVLRGVTTCAAAA
jgi:hypothetical protein